LLSNGTINNNSWQKKRCFPWGPCLGIIRGHSQKNTRNMKEYEWVQPSSGVQFSSVQLEVRMVPVGCTVGRWWQCVR
jgi:hypothetical protein